MKGMVVWGCQNQGREMEESLDDGYLILGNATGRRCEFQDFNFRGKNTAANDSAVREITAKNNIDNILLFFFFFLRKK